MSIKRLFPLLCAVLLIGCKNNTSVSVDFSTTRLTPLMYEFTNYSTGCDSYKWDFGDGTWANGTNAMHVYESTGTYIVTLSGYADGSRHEKRTTIEATKPEVYIAGYTLYNIPYENRYYKAVFKDDNLFPSDWDFQSAYTPLLTLEDLPYTFTFQNPHIMYPTQHDYYTVQVIRTTNAANADNDVSCTKQKLTQKELLQYKPEYVLTTSTDATTIGVHMIYAY